MDVAALTETGGLLFATKFLLASLQFLWLYDYLLTLGDELQYAWQGRRSWVFALFVANRYFPAVYILWLHFVLFHYSQSFCLHTKWVPVLQSNAITTLAQIAVSLRVYAITHKNTTIGGILVLQIAAGICFGIFSAVEIGLGPLQPFPDINLDEFKLCIFKLWRVGQLAYYNLAMTFDVIVFLIIAIAAWKERTHRYPGIPSILDTIVRDATKYFLLISSVHLLSVLFVFVAPVDIQLFPPMVNMVLVPVMTSRLMVSLKKASVEPEAAWTLQSMNNTTLARDGTVRFAFGGLQEIPLYPTVTDGEGMLPGATP
ncbi:hypothetical protein BJ322DRAFT_1095726 [Thelephora terrestris]|uniref:DUF6533 domain-containing protein n=1 Tax=Thelephora terrestris TaxID=56493 RepID=A0A9P6L103_9AGAM|nr:hypothetical protein BJ322DRAFT_1095726 [Thelephora terrestris]